MLLYILVKVLLLLLFIDMVIDMFNYCYGDDK